MGTCAAPANTAVIPTTTNGAGGRSGIVAHALPSIAPAKRLGANTPPEPPLPPPLSLTCTDDHRLRFRKVRLVFIVARAVVGNHHPDSSESCRRRRDGTWVLSMFRNSHRTAPTVHPTSPHHTTKQSVAAPVRLERAPTLTSPRRSARMPHIAASTPATMPHGRIPWRTMKRVRRSSPHVRVFAPLEKQHGANCGSGLQRKIYGASPLFVTSFTLASGAGGP